MSILLCIHSLPRSITHPSGDSPSGFRIGRIVQDLHQHSALRPDEVADVVDDFLAHISLIEHRNLLQAKWVAATERASWASRSIDRSINQSIISCSSILELLLLQRAGAPGLPHKGTLVRRDTLGPQIHLAPAGLQTCSHLLAGGRRSFARTAPGRNGTVYRQRPAHSETH